MRKLQEQESRGISCSDKEWRVGEYLDYWLYEVQQNCIEESTLDSYERIIKKHLKPALGGHRLKELSVQNVRQSIDTIIENGYAGLVASKCMQVLRSCLKHAMREELIMRNVAALVEKPKYKPNERVVWSAEQSA
jgi:site-specific recombinase XerD